MCGQRANNEAYKLVQIFILNDSKNENDSICKEARVLRLGSQKKNKLRSIFRYSAFLLSGKGRLPDDDDP